MNPALTVDPLLAILPTEAIKIQDAPGGSWRTIDKVFVDRVASEDVFGGNQGNRPRILLEIKTGAPGGLAGNFDQGQTTFCVAQRIGGAADETVPANLMKCLKLLSSDEGMIRMELR